MNNIYKSKRRKTVQIYYKNVAVGGGAPVTVQSMTNTDTSNVQKTVAQIKQLTEAGCEIIRVAVPDKNCAKKLSDIKKQIKIPLIADIHFDYKLALESIKQGIDGLRINPGNIGRKENIIKVVNAAAEADIPIRVGVNSGSISENILKKYGHPTAEAMVESALNNINTLEEQDFYNIIVSLKSTDIWRTIAAYKILAAKTDYPFHIGITEAGTGFNGIVKSATGLGSLLTRGYGDTLRVSLTGEPLEEVKTGWKILESLNLRQRGPRLISCPTCGRTNIDLIELTKKVEKRLTEISSNITVAVMGCAVNGPGEAKVADIGIAGGKNEGLIFIKGKKIKKVPEEKLVDTLIEEIIKLEGED